MPKVAKQSCKRCSRVFVGHSKRVYCQTETERSCSICKSNFSAICDKKDRSRCLGCSSKVVRQCKACSRSFIANSHREYFCADSFQRGCKNCCEEFSSPCSNYGHSRSTCSKVCAITIASSREELNNCKRCGGVFTGTAITLYCGTEKEFDCKVCGISFSAPCDKGLRATCSRLCSQLTGSSINSDRARELHSLPLWVNHFKLSHRRQPSKQDFRRYFGIKPSEESSKLLKKARGSSLEDEVYEFMKTLVVEDSIVRNSRPLRTDDNRPLELDFILKKHSLAIEVQDFLSHSRASDSESSRWNNLKRGPTYHSLKQRLAKEQLNLELIELWEDQILDGSFKSILEKRLSDSEATPKQNQH